MSINDASLFYWRKNRYTDQDVDNLCLKLDNILAIKVQLTPGQVPLLTFSRRLVESGEGHLPAVLKFISDAVPLQPASGWRGSFVMWLEDGMWETYHHLSRYAPMMAFGRHLSDTFTFLIPDPAFMNSVGYQKELAEIAEVEKNMTWESKIPKTFWRGGSSGLGITTNRWQECSRVCLVTESKALNQPERIDAYISKVDLAPDMPGYRGLYDQALLGNYVPLIEFFKYRYLIDVDGNCASWISCFLKLSSNSLVVKVWSPYQEWYYNRIRAWEHFVPVRANCSDIGQTLDWIDSNQNECQQIVKNARAAMSQITYQQSLQEFSELITQILACNKQNS